MLDVEARTRERRRRFAADFPRTQRRGLTVMKDGKEMCEGKKGGLGRLFEWRWDEVYIWE